MRILKNNSNSSSRYYPVLFWVVAVLFVMICASVFVYLFLVVFDLPFSQTIDEIFTKKIFDLAIRSLFLALIVSSLASVFGLLFAWLIERTDLVFKKLWNVLIILTMAMPSYVLAYSWLEKFERVASLSGAVFILTLVTTPFAYLNMRIAVKKLDVQLEDVANSLGSRTHEMFLRIIFPQLKRAYLAGMLICFLYVITDFGAVSTLRVEVFTWVIYGAYRAGFSPERAAILSILLFCIALIIVVLEGLVSSRKKQSEVTKVQLKAKPAKLGKLNLVAQIVLAAYIGLTLIFPFVRAVGWTFEYRSNFSFEDFKQPLLNTLAIGLITASVATFIAFCISVVAAQSKTGKTISRFVMAIHSIPGVVTAIAFVFVGTRLVPGIYLEWPLVITALCVSFGYLAITPIKNSLDKKNKTLLDVSSSLGRGKYFTLANVTIPLSANGLKAAAILVFVATIKELPITLLLRPNEQNTLATYLWSNLGVSKFAVVAPSTLSLIIISAVPLLFLIKGKYD